MIHDLSLALGQEWTAILLAIAIPVISGAVIAVTAIVSTHWRKLRQAELEASLKHEMLDRGMSAEEIALVMQPSRLRGSKLREVAQEFERVIQAAKNPAAGRCG